jgi:hypothetical protein
MIATFMVLTMGVMVTMIMSMILKAHMMKVMTMTAVAIDNYVWGIMMCTKWA